MFIHGCYSSSLCKLSPGAPLAEASGHPWCGPLGRWRSVCQSSSRKVQTVVLDLFLSGLPVTPCAGFSASALRRCAFVRGTVPVSGDRYLPHQRRCVAHAGRAVPARALEAVCLPHGAPVFGGVREPKVSRPWSRQSPTPTGLRCQTASQGHTLRCASRPCWFRDSGPGARGEFLNNSHDITRASDQVQRLKTNKVD